MRDPKDAALLTSAELAPEGGPGHRGRHQQLPQGVVRGGSATIGRMPARTGQGHNPPGQTIDSSVRWGAAPELRAVPAVPVAATTAPTRRPTKDLHVNIRSLTRGDGVVIGAAVVLFIASFLDYFDYGQHQRRRTELLGFASARDRCLHGRVSSVPHSSCCHVRSRSRARSPVSTSASSVSRHRCSPHGACFWTIIDLGQIDAGAGLILGLHRHPGAGRGRGRLPAGSGPQGPAGGRPEAAGRAPAVRWPAEPGLRLPGRPAAALRRQPQGQAPAFGGQPQAGQPDPQQAQAPAQQAAPAGDFTPFWFAVPVARPLYGEDGSPSPIAELAPGTWYLAVEQSGSGLIAQTQDGRRGVLQDTTGIQRG